MLTGSEIRRKFLDFFVQQKQRPHREVHSSSLVPQNDPTLLFTNAGMNQFKDVFLGIEQRDYTRATTSQKCVRAGGKHNDLENVGFTNRHHTFFEMLGNFSFGDYFKKDAIAYAWELITSPKWFGIPVEKLTFTVFGGAELAPGTILGVDEEAINLWINVGTPRESVIAVPGLKENFWAMGDSGPCGPCSEIFYDMGPAASDQGHTDCKFGCDCGRYVEIWNLVFMQFNRDASGKLNPLPKPSVDTGAGLERVTAVLQGKISNFDTDLFRPLIYAACEIVGVMHPESMISSDSPFRSSLRVIADHSRSATFLIADGVIPSNERRGYVLRKIIRRALHHAALLGAPPGFMSKMSEVVRKEMGAVYPEIEEAATRISRVLDEEEKRFKRTVRTGVARLERLVANEVLAAYSRSPKSDQDSQVVSFVASSLKEGDKELTRTATQAVMEMAKSLQATGNPVSLRGEDAFPLYDTYGLPRDFIDDTLRDARVSVDWTGFDKAMEEQRTRARASWKGTHKDAANPVYSKLAQTFKTEPDFYFGTSTQDCRIESIVTKAGSVNEIPKGAEAEIVLDRTTIYAESGGQVADTGGFFDNSGALEVAGVSGAYYPVTSMIPQGSVAKEDLRVGHRVPTVAGPVRRACDMRNHTATHL